MLAEKEKKRIERAGFNTNRPPYWKIFKEAFPQLFNVFLIFFVTLSVFPAVYSDIKQHDDDFVIPKDMFTTVTCFLTFNLCAMLGSLLTSWVKWVSVCYIFVTLARLTFNNTSIYSQVHDSSSGQLLLVSLLSLYSSSATTNHSELNAFCRFT